eukprot:4392193-Amphidinium_carterae.1
MRTFLRQAVSIVLHQDGRKEVLLTRFTACDAKLNLFNGVLPLSHSARHAGHHIADLTLNSIKDLCTPYLGAPGTHAKIAPRHMHRTDPVHE